MTSSYVNEYEAYHRQKKVDALVAVIGPVLADAGVGPEIMNDELWALATKKAELKSPPSDITKALVIEALGGGETAQPLNPTLAPSVPPQEAASPPSESSPAPVVNGVRQAPEGESAASPVRRGREKPALRDPSSTPTLFDFAQSREAMEHAIQRVDDNADEGWKLRALQAIRAVAERQPYLVVDDCWGDSLEEPREKRAMGAMMRRAQKEGWITTTSEYRPSTRVAAHLGPRRLWKSLIYKEGPRFDHPADVLEGLPR